MVVAGGSQREMLSLEKIAWLTCFYIVFGLFHPKICYKEYVFDVINFNVEAQSHTITVT